MWDHVITLRLGAAADTLVSVEFHLDEGCEIPLDRWHRWLGAWIEPRINQRSGDTGAVAPALHVYLPDARWHQTSLVPQIRYGTHVLVRARQPGAIVDALATLLAGIDQAADAGEATQVALRIFSDGNDAVLVDAKSPILVNDPWLAQRGVVEHAAWGVAISGAAGETMASVAAPLARLDWEAMNVVANIASLPEASAGRAMRVAAIAGIERAAPSTI